MIKRISINGQDVSAALAEGEVITQTDRGRWRLTLQLDPNGAATSELLSECVGSTVNVEVYETRGTVLKGAAVVSRFDPLTWYSELTGEGHYTRERAARRPDDGRSE
jgi:hypothetical protein